MRDNLRGNSGDDFRDNFGDNGGDKVKKGDKSGGPIGTIFAPRHHGVSFGPLGTLPFLRQQKNLKRKVFNEAFAICMYIELCSSPGRSIPKGTNPLALAEIMGCTAGAWLKTLELRSCQPLTEVKTEQSGKGHPLT